jgi:iron complex transport system substrate-binding protein
MKRGPQRIVCLTEETTEWLYLLGEESRIVGISGYTVRPPRARHECDILQPGPAALSDGLEQLHRFLAAWTAAGAA